MFKKNFQSCGLFSQANIKKNYNKQLKEIVVVE